MIIEQKDLRDRLATVSDTAGVIAGYTYDNANRVQARAYANGVTATHTHDALNRITSLDHVRNGTRIAGFTHSYDNEGNKKYEQKLHQPANSEAYSYDSLYRLIDYRVGALAGDTIPSPTNHSTWALDPVGNWNNRVTDGATETRTHNAANEIESLASAGATNAVTHDANGNLTSIQDPASSYQYEYDEFNRLVRVSVVSGQLSVVSEFAYDALGRRIMKRTWPGGLLNETCFVYDSARIIEEKACSGGTPITYTYGNYVDEVLTRDTGTQRLYYSQNTLFSVVALTDAAGNVVERYTYDAYGAPSFFDSAGLQQPASSIQNRLLFTGREWDAESAIYHYRARPYSPTLGRFLSRDPLGYVDGLNLYEYTEGQPSIGVDPSGLSKYDFNNHWRTYQNNITGNLGVTYVRFPPGDHWATRGDCEKGRAQFFFVVDLYTEILNPAWKDEWASASVPKTSDPEVIEAFMLGPKQWRKRVHAVKRHEAKHRKGFAEAYKMTVRTLKTYEGCYSSVEECIRTCDGALTRTAQEWNQYLTQHYKSLGEEYP